MIGKSVKRSLLSSIMAVALVASAIAAPAAATNQQQEITVSYSGISVFLHSQQCSLEDYNGDTVEPFSYNGTVYLPLRAISEALNLTAEYDEAAHAVNLTGTISTSSEMDGNVTTGTPAEGTAPTGTPPEGTPPTGTPPDGTAPTGAPPKDGTPPTGEPPAGNPPGTNEIGDTSGNEMQFASSEQQIEISYEDIKVYLNGELLELEDADGNIIEPFSCNGSIYLPLRAITEALGLTPSYEAGSHRVNLNSSNGQPGSLTGSPTDTPDGTSSDSATGTGILTVDGSSQTLDAQTIVATEVNQSGILASNAGTLVLTKSTVDKTGDSSSEENSNFTGVNAGVLAQTAGTINLQDCEITTDASGSNAVFATGDGSQIILSNVSITTKQDSSRGLDATYNGKVTATNVNINTSGAHCAALATDRGEGTIDVNGGTMQTAGEGSPGIYSTGTIIVEDATLTAAGSEAAVVEGKNSITLTNVKLSGAKKCGVMLYQSFSGDASVGTSSFDMTGGTLTAATGPLFYCTNTDTVIVLNGATLEGSNELISAAADRWGTEGSNGASVAFTADDEVLLGDIIADSISEIRAAMKNGTTWEGAFNASQEAGFASLSLDASSSWSLTANSYLDEFVDGDATLANLHDNGFSIFYDSSAAANSWLNGKTFNLPDGGKLCPM